MTAAWELIAQRVTKYDPRFREHPGRYRRAEWTSFYDIGYSFNGHILTLEEYKETEDKYVLAVLLFLDAIGCKRVRINNLEKHEAAHHLNEEELARFSALQEGMLVPAAEVAPIVRLILRESIWCELLCERRPTWGVHFGYDYYMYLCSENQSPALWKTIQDLGLFVD